MIAGNSGTDGEVEGDSVGEGMGVGVDVGIGVGVMVGGVGAFGSGDVRIGWKVTVPKLKSYFES